MGKFPRWNEASDKWERHHLVNYLPDTENLLANCRDLIRKEDKKERRTLLSNQDPPSFCLGGNIAWTLKIRNNHITKNYNPETTTLQVTTMRRSGPEDY